MAVTFASLDVPPVGGSIVGTWARGCATCHIPAVTDGTLGCGLVTSPRWPRCESCDASREICSASSRSLPAPSEAGLLGLDLTFNPD
jgi:hypothetical protein